MTDYSTRKMHLYVFGPYRSQALVGDFDGGAPSSFTVSQPMSVDTIYRDQRIGSDNPRWRDIIRQGQDATTFFSGSAFSEPFHCWVTATIKGTEIRKADSHQRDVSYQFDGNPSVDYPPSSGGNPDSSVKADVKNRVIRRFLDAIDTAQTSFEAGQDLGEYKETLHSIQRPLGPLRERILSYFDRLTKVGISKYRINKHGLTKTIADTYLEFHFGWQPLVDDVAKAIADCGRFRFPVIPVRASQHAVFSVQDINVHSQWPFFPVGYTRKYRETSTYFLRYKGAIKTRNLMPSGQISLAQSLQLTPDKWLPTVWDLLPYSWMADYFVNIGEIIRGFSALSTNFAWGCVTERIRTERAYSEYVLSPFTFDPNGPSAAGSIVQSSLGGTGVTWAQSVVRSHLDGTSLVPELQFSVPTSNYAFANMGSVLRQRGSKISNYLATKFGIKKT
jgi:hypothetical protein